MTTDPYDTRTLTGLVDELSDDARAGDSGRAARTVHGGAGHALRQTVIALAAGHELAEHESPGEATLQVLRGSVRLVSGTRQWDLGAGDLVAIPPERHSLAASQDSAVLLTVALTR